MTLSSVSASPALEVLANPKSASEVQTEVAVRMLKKANDQITQQGQSVIALIERVGDLAQQGLDTYA